MPILEKVSGLNFISGSGDEAMMGLFGYSPERVNPGDKSRRISDIVKITSASTAKSASMSSTIQNRSRCWHTHGKY